MWETEILRVIDIHMCYSVKCNENCETQLRQLLDKPLVKQKCVFFMLSFNTLFNAQNTAVAFTA